MATKTLFFTCKHCGEKKEILISFSNSKVPEDSEEFQSRLKNIQNSICSKCGKRGFKTETNDKS